ncbi:MAG: PQQ-dependent sugar dehydrogenase [Thermoanaerobaculia bacterium]
MRTNRRHSRLTVQVAATALLFISTSALAQIPRGDITIQLETIASGLVAPVAVTHAGDRSGRLFIVDQPGQIWIVEDGSLLTTPFLDISAKLVALNPFFDERGLLGLAFHPKYKQNGRFFVRYSAPRAGDPAEPCFGTTRGCHEEILAEYSVSVDDHNIADPASEIILFRVDEPQFNNNAGTVAFGPDGFLYFSLGDGGGAHDGLADVPPSHGPIGNGQNIETPLGAILRIDVDGPPDPGLAYGIPPDNPFAGAFGADEIYAYGMRNPYKFSFDDGPGGDGALLLADVGQNLFEEVDVIERGGNYGWVIREGFSCFDPFNPQNPPASCPDTGPLGEPLIDPIVDYAHEDGGIAVVGGFVYRGPGSPSLRGTYVFGDFASAFFAPSGRLYFLVEPTPSSFEIRQFQIGADDRPLGLFLKGFGEDEEGELYACGSTTLAPTGNTGVVQRIVVQGDYGGRPLTTVLTGDAEVPGPGDPDGSGLARITLNQGLRKVCFDLEVFDIEPAFAAHIHRGAAGENGPVVVTLGPPTTGSSSGCVGGVAPSLIKEIRQHPSGFYVNVHNAEFPPGALRGQLSK